jgi:hypothetical protein
LELLVPGPVYPSALFTRTLETHKTHLSKLYTVERKPLLVNPILSLSEAVRANTALPLLPLSARIGKRLPAKHWVGRIKEK